MMRSRILLYLLAGLFNLFLIVPVATAAVTLDASPASVAQSSAVTATWSGIVNPSPTDWIGLYTAGSTGSYWAWVYVSCTTSAGSAAAAGTCPVGVPFSVPNGNYELRLFANNGNTRLATSNQFTVGPSSLPAVTIAVTDNTATENNPADTGVFTVSRTGATTGALTVNYAVSGTATNATDYQNLPGSVTIPVNAGSATITVTPIDDGGAEGNETVIVTLSANPAYLVGTPGSGTVTIVDDEPTVTIAVTDGSATENNQADTGVFTVSRTGSTASALTVNYVVTGTATNGTDYQNLPGSVVIGVGQSTALITVTTFNDGLAEGNETVIVTLSANAAYLVGTPASGTVTIVDDEPAATGPSIGASPASVAQSSAVTATWSGIVNPTATDWIGLYTAGSTGSYWAWVYVSCTTSAGSAAASGSCPIGVPFSVPNGSYELRLFANNGTTRLATSNQFTVGLSSLPVVTIAVTDNTATENNPADTGLFTVSRTGATTAALTVNYAVSGTATNGTDYQNLPTSVTIAANASTATITVVPIDDGAAEGNETVIVTLSANAAYTVGTPGSGTVTIVDDEPPLPTLTIAVTDNTATENNPADTGVFIVSRTGATTAALTVNYVVSGTATNGTDYQNLPASVTIAANASTATITVVPIDDGTVEGNETVIVTLSANAAYTVGTPGSGTVTIVDDEPPLPTLTIAVTDNTATEGTPADTGLFTMSRTGPTTAALTVNYAVSGTATNGTDYQNLPGSVVIGVGQSTALITVTTINDGLVEGNETVIVTLSANAAYLVGTPASGTVTIVDDEPAAGPSIGASPASVAQLSAVTATWSGIVNPTATDWIGLYTAGSTGSYWAWVYVSCTTSAGSAAASGTCPVGVPFSAPNGSYELRLFANSGTRLATSNQFTVGPSSLPVVTIAATDNTATENNPADTGLFTVSRTGATTAALTVNYVVSGTATNGTDYQNLPTSMTIAANASTATITVVPIDDGTAEGNETVIVTLSANAAYTIGSPASGMVTIVDDEPPLPTVTIAVTDNTATENNAADTGVFTVSRTGATTAALTVNYAVSGTATNGTDYQNLPGSVTIPANASSATITVTPIDDSLNEGNETVVVTLSANAAYTVGAPANGTVTIVDNDVPAGPSVTASVTSVAPGSVLTASWNGIVSPAAHDWIGVYSPGAPDNPASLNWMYVSCSQTSGTSISASGSCPFGIPAGVNTGNYELRFFSNNTYTRLATSSQFAVKPVTVVTGSLPDGTLNFQYNRTLVASGGTGSYSWSITSGALPGGLTLSSAGVFSGTPTAAGTATFTARAQDSLLATATKSLSLTINATVLPLIITTDSLPSSQVSLPFNQALAATGGISPYTWTLLSGSLPKGLSLSADGVLSGTPYEIGTSTFTVRVQDSTNLTDTQAYMQTILVTPVPRRVVGYWSFDDGTAIDDSGMRYDGTLVGSPTVVPGKRGQALSFDGAGQHVNVGNVLDNGSGNLSIFAWVKTTATGSAQMIVAKGDSRDTSRGGYELFQNSSGRLAFIFGWSPFNPAIPYVRKDSAGPQINDGNWHFVGVVLRRSGNGVLYVDGVPALDGSANISSTDGNNGIDLPLRIGADEGGYYWNGAIDDVRVIARRIFSDQQVLDMYNQPLGIVANSLPAGAINAAYSQTLTGLGGSLPYTWSIASGSLPSGLSLASNGVLSGTPTASGTFNFTVRLDDNALHTTTQALSLAVNSAQQVLLSDNFTGTLANWTIFDEPPGTLGCDSPSTNCDGPSVWVITNGDLIQKSNFNVGSVTPVDPVKPGTYALAGSAAWQDYTFSLRLMSEDNDALGVMFRYQDNQNYYRFSIDNEGPYRRLVKVVGGVTTILAQDAIVYEIGQSYNVRVSAVGNRIQIFIDNKLLFDVLDNSLATGKIALYAWGDEYAHFGDVLVTSP